MLPITTTLFDIYFASCYQYYNSKPKKGVTINSLLRDNIFSIMERVKQSKESPHPTFAYFLNHKPNENELVKPTGRLARLLEADLKLLEVCDALDKHLKSDSPDHGAWTTKKLPSFFVDRPDYGGTHFILDNFDDFYPTEEGVYWSQQDLDDSTTLAGFLKSDLEFRIVCKHFDRKALTTLTTLLSRFGLKLSSPQKAGLFGTLQAYSINIQPIQLDIDYAKHSMEFRKSLSDHFERHGNGRNYYIATDNNPVSHGLKTQDDVSRFLNEIKPIVSMQANSTHIYVSRTQELVSVMNKDGQNVPLIKFGFSLCELLATKVASFKDAT